MLRLVQAWYIVQIRWRRPSGDKCKVGALADRVEYDRS